MWDLQTKEAKQPELGCQLLGVLCSSVWNTGRPRKLIPARVQAPRDARLYLASDSQH